MFFRFLFILQFFVLSIIPSVQAQQDAECHLIGAEYVPQNQMVKSYDKEKHNVNRSLSFVMHFENGDMDGSLRTLFLNVDAYNQDGVKVSRMRLGNAWSNGVSRESFSAAYGVYCDLVPEDPGDIRPKRIRDLDRMECPSLERGPGFYLIGVNEDLSKAALRDAPALLIMPETYHVLRDTSYQIEKDWDKYIRFYTDERIYPDFRGYDFWVRQKCG